MRWKIMVPVMVLVLLLSACGSAESLVIEPTSETITPEGGEVVFPNGVSITFPEGAVSQEGEVSISMSTDAVNEYGIPEITPIFTFDVPGGELLEPVRLAFPLPEDVDLDLETYQVFHLDEDVPGLVDPVTGEGGPPEWVLLPTVVEDGFVTAWTDSFSDFKVTRGIDRNKVSFEMTPSVAPEYVPGTEIAASVSGEVCIDPEVMFGDEVHVYANLMLEEGWFSYDTELDSYAALARLDEDGCYDFNYPFNEDISDLVDGRRRFDVYVHMEVHSWGSHPDKNESLDGYYMHFIESTSKRFRVREADAPQITIEPIVARPAQTFAVLGELFKPDETVTISWGTRNGEVLVIVEPESDGTFRAPARVPLDIPSEWYTVTASNESGSLTASVDIGIMEPLEEEGEEEDEVEEPLAALPETCLELTILDQGGGFVLLSSPNIPTYELTYMIEDHCGTAEPGDWVVVNGLPELAEVEVEDRLHLKVSLDRGAVPAGTYFGNVGLHYPGNGQPAVEELVVEVADLEYVYPGSIERTSVLNHAWGKNNTTEGEFTCTRVGGGTVPENERYFDGTVVIDCPDGHEDWEDEWEYRVDRLTGELLFSSCVDCYDNLDPNPDCQGPEGTYAGYLMPLVTETVENSWVANEVDTDDTQGVWTWVETETRIFDGITGTWVEQIWVGKKLFTGTYNGQQLTNKDYGYWRRGNLVVETSTQPLGYASLEEGAAEEEVVEEPPEQDCGEEGVPDIVSQGLSLSDAGALLDSLGYSYTWEDRYLDAENVGLIVDQAPSAGFCGTPENTILVITRNRGEP